MKQPIHRAYDRLGRQVSAIVDGVSTNTYTYDSTTLALSVETQNGMEINRTTDALGRDTGFSLGSDYSVQYGFDAYGRFHSVSSSVRSVSSVVEYSRLADSDLISGMSTSSGFLWTRAYESARSLITSAENRFDETVISRYDYENDELGRRVSRADSGLAFANPAFDKYSYNDRSEVTGAQRYHGTDVADTSTVYGGRDFGYAYDPIGNRISASETVGGETLSKTYAANALNQYTAIANPDAVGLRGDATNTAVVTVNSETVQRDTIASSSVPWHFALEADNASGPDFPLAEIVAVINPPDTNTPALVSTATGHVYAPPQSETLVYDDDGNLLSDGRWQYTWNGENRLIKAEELVSPTNRQPYVVEYTYDHQGRMVWKTVASSNAPPSQTIRYLWDGYNIIAEYTATDTQTNIAYNVWGLDLSGSLQGAGGVGGLLAVIKDSETYTPAFDANGNITEYLSTDGTIAAHYEYSPFGEIVEESGDLAASFTHRFSTKPWCAVTGLNEYLFRKYSPKVGRWLNCDPIRERGGQNLYAFVRNRSITLVDLYGLKAKDNKRCCCNKKAFSFEKQCCISDNEVAGKNCNIRIYIGHDSPTIKKKMEDQASVTGADRVAAVSCNQKKSNGWVPEELRYPNAARKDEPLYWDWDKVGSAPGPTFLSEVELEIEAAKTEADNMCNVSTSRGLCCDQITVELVYADKDGSKWLASYYNEQITKQVHKKTCDKSCKSRGGTFMVPDKGGK